jgi:hypothetical protein
MHRPITSLDKTFEFLGRGRAEQRSVGLVHFGGDKIQPFLHPVAIDRAGRRGKPGAGLLVGEALYHDRTLGQPLTVSDLQQRNLALGIDAPKIPTGLRLLLRDIGPLEFKVDTGLAENNLRRE